MQLHASLHSYASMLSIVGDVNAIDIVVVAVGVSVGGFSLAVVILSIILLTAVYQVRQRGTEKVYGVDSHGTWTGEKSWVCKLSYIRFFSLWSVFKLVPSSF